MTVSSSTSKSGPYTGNGATTVFAFAFKVQQAADVKVVRTVTTNGTQVDTTLTSGADFNVSVNADQSASPGGTVTMTAAPTASQKITILRNVTATQGTSIPNQGGFYPKVLESALDKLTMLVQQLSEESARALKVSVADSITNLQDLLIALNTAVSNAGTSAGSASGSAAAASGSATAAGASAVLASQWAITTGAQVAATDYSAKEWAVGTYTRGNASGGSAKDWASYTGGTVDGTSYSAKYYAAQAAASAASIAGGPVTSVNGMTGVVTGLATQTGAETLTNKTITSPELTTAPYVNGSLRGNVVPVAALDIDCSAGNYFTKTINGASAFTFSNAPASRSYGFTLELTHTSGAITWPASVKWAKDTAPTLTAGKTHVFVFVTDDGGARWRGAALVDYVN